MNIKAFSLVNIYILNNYELKPAAKFLIFLNLIQFNAKDAVM